MNYNYFQRYKKINQQSFSNFLATSYIFQKQIKKKKANSYKINKIYKKQIMQRSYLDFVTIGTMIVGR